MAIPSPLHYGLNWPGKAAAAKQAEAPNQQVLAKADTSDTDPVDVNAGHLFIEGDNLAALRLLRPTLGGKVRVIYIDPPYNTGNETILYEDSFAETQRAFADRTDTSAADEHGRYHTRWLNMMYPRLLLAHQLLADDGVLLVSISEEEVANLKLVLNEVFGEVNFRNSIIARRHDKNLNRQFRDRGLKTLNVGYEYILAYAKTDAFNFVPVYRAASEKRATTGYWKGFWNDADRPTMRYDIHGVLPPAGQWKWKESVAREAIANYDNFLSTHAATETLEEHWRRTGKERKFIRRNPKGKGKNLGVEHWIPPSEGVLRSSNWTDMLVSKADPSIQGLFSFPKNVEVIKELLRACAKTDDTVLDFFAGSGTTAQAVLELNAEDGGSRRFVCVQLAEECTPGSKAEQAGFATIADIARERIRRVGERLAGGMFGSVGFVNAVLRDDK